MENGNKNTHRVITFLTREQLDFLDNIGKDALFSTGYKLSRTKIIFALIEGVRKLGLNGIGIRAIEELDKKVIELIKERLVKAHIVSNVSPLITALKQSEEEQAEVKREGGKDAQWPI